MKLKVERRAALAGWLPAEHLSRPAIEYAKKDSRMKMPAVTFVLALAVVAVMVSGCDASGPVVPPGAPGPGAPDPGKSPLIFVGPQFSTKPLQEWSNNPVFTTGGELSDSRQEWLEYRLVLPEASGGRAPYRYSLTVEFVNIGIGPFGSPFPHETPPIGQKTRTLSGLPYLESLYRHFYRMTSKTEDADDDVREAPPGMRFDQKTRTLSGLPYLESPYRHSYRMTFKAEDYDGDSIRLRFYIRVKERNVPAAVSTTLNAPNGRQAPRGCLQIETVRDRQVVENICTNINRDISVWYCNFSLGQCNTNGRRREGLPGWPPSPLVVFDVPPQPYYHEFVYLEPGATRILSIHPDKGQEYHYAVCEGNAANVHWEDPLGHHLSPIFGFKAFDYGQLTSDEQGDYACLDVMWSWHGAEPGRPGLYPPPPCDEYGNLSCWLRTRPE